MGFFNQHHTFTLVLVYRRASMNMVTFLHRALHTIAATLCSKWLRGTWGIAKWTKIPRTAYCKIHCLLISVRWILKANNYWRIGRFISSHLSNGRLWQGYSRYHSFELHVLTFTCTLIWLVTTSRCVPGIFREVHNSFSLWF